MGVLVDAIRRFLEALRDPATEENSAKRLMVMAAQAGMSVNAAEREEGLRLLVASLRTARPRQGGHIALCAGTLAEQGANPLTLTEPLVQRLPEVLFLANQFWNRIGEEVRRTPTGVGSGSSSKYGLTFGGEAISDTIVDQLLAKGRDDSSDAFFALMEWCLPAITCLSVDLPQRRLAQSGKLPELATSLSEADDTVAFLDRLLHVLDDEPLLVIHPETRQAFLCRISGISSNYQLHTLLADALIEAKSTAVSGLVARLFGGQEREPSHRVLQGRRPDPKVVAVALGNGSQISPVTSHGVWNLYHWFALSPRATLPQRLERLETWIYNEGRPDEIEFFEGIRVVLLGPTMVERTWRTTRDFERLRASFRVERVLSPAQVDEWISHLAKAAAAREAAPETH